MRSVTKSIARVDGIDKATGKARYGADVQLDNLLQTAVYRAPMHHALIKAIHIEEAEKMPGVVKVVTAADITGSKMFGPDVVDKPVIAFDKVRQIGDAIAIVVAETKDQAQKALDKIEVEFEELTPVLNPVKALEPGSPLVQENGNQLSENRYSQGDIEQGFQEADVIVEETFEVQLVSPAYLETEVSTASYQPDGSLHVWANTQMPFQDQKTISETLAVPIEKVHVISPNIGGSFGGKSDATITLLAAVCAWAVKGNVRLMNSRKESMIAHPKRHPGVLKYKVGAKKDGTLVALKADFTFNTGAYASYGKAVGGISSEMAGGPYHTPNVEVVTRVAYTNIPFGGSIRGVSGPQVSFACESVMDMVAAELKMDPIAFRKKNIWRKGDVSYFGVEMFEEPSIALCLDKAEELRQGFGLGKADDGKLYGVGIASSLLKAGMGYGIPDDSTNRIEWLANGKVRLWIGSPDIGQGLKTIGAQITAELLDIPLEDVEIAVLDTSVSPNGGPTNTSRTTLIVSNSLEKTAEKAIAVLKKFACEELETSPDRLTYAHGNIVLDDKEIPFAELAEKAEKIGFKLIAEATASFPYPEGTNLPVGTHVQLCFGVHLALVAVDPIFGQVEVKDYIAIHDVGRAINPMGVEGQIEGGVAMGIGYALLEEMKLRPNNTWVDNFSEYILPTMLDIPHIQSVIVEQPYPYSLYGVKGLGEPVTTAVAPAIANAVFAATGKRITKLPINSDDLIMD